MSSTGSITATVRVTNTSDVGGAETVMWYIQDVASRTVRPVKELRHFEKAFILAGENKDFSFEIEALRDLGSFNSEGNRYVEAGEFKIIVGKQSRSIILK